MADDSWQENRSETPEPGLQSRLKQAARAYPYPPTPDLAARERQRVQQHASSQRNGRLLTTERAHRPTARRLGRAAWAMVAVVLLASLILVSPARARVIEWLRVGAVRIFLEPSTAPLPTVEPTALTGLAGETTLAQAAEEAGFPLRLPTYPPELGEPQRVYLQHINGAPVVILVWLEPDRPEEVRLALYEIGEGNIFEKHLLENAQETTVNGDWALWVEGPYLLTNMEGQVEQRRVVTGRTLIWFADEITYRLESDLPLDEARKIAESLSHWQ